MTKNNRTVENLLVQSDLENSSYKPKKRQDLPKHTSTGSLNCHETDLQKLIERGIADPKWFKFILPNISMIKMLDCAEESIKASKTMKPKDREELLQLITEHPLRKGDIN